MTREDQIIADAVMTHLGGELIDPLSAVVIANAFHDGQWSALYSFVSTGAIDLDGMLREIDRTRDTGLYDEQGLPALRAYVESIGDRPPCEVWQPRW